MQTLTMLNHNLTFCSVKRPSLVLDCEGSLAVISHLPRRPILSASILQKQHHWLSPKHQVKSRQHQPCPDLARHIQRKPLFAEVEGWGWELNDWYRLVLLRICTMIRSYCGVYVREAESGLIAGDLAVVLFWREFEGGKDGFRRVERNVGLVRSPVETTRKACGVPRRLRRVRVSWLLSGFQKSWPCFIWCLWW